MRISSSKRVIFKNFGRAIFLLAAVISCSGDVGGPPGGGANEPGRTHFTPPGFAGNGEAYNGPHLSAQSIPLRYDSRQGTDRLAGAVNLCLQAAYFQLAAQVFGDEAEMILDKSEQRYSLEAEAKEKHNPPTFFSLGVGSTLFFRSAEGIEYRLEGSADVAFLGVNRPPPESLFLAITIMREDDFRRSQQYPDRKPQPESLDLTLKHGPPFMVIDTDDEPYVRADGAIFDVIMRDFRLALPADHGPRVQFVGLKDHLPTPYAFNSEAFAMCLQNYTLIMEAP